MFVFSMIGNVVTSEQERQTKDLHIYLLDQDKSDYSKFLSQNLSDTFTNVELITDRTEASILNQMQAKHEQSLIVIPDGFNDALLAEVSSTIKTYSCMYNFSFLSNISVSQTSALMTTVDEITGTYLLTTKGGITNPEFYKHPVKTENIIMVQDYSAEADPNVVLNVIASQSTLVPIVLFLVITVAAQLVATAIATEKENKTLETLLSCPISRKLIVAAKLIGAGLVSLIMAATYLYGMSNYMSGMTGGLGTAGNDIQKVLEQLHLTLAFNDYVILGLSIFLAILAALSMAFILGSLAEDSRSAQATIAPIMMMLLVPYLLTMVLDISTLAPWIKILLYALPFTHTFTVMPNLYAGNYTAILMGDLYLAVLVLITILAAGKIFSSDTILTFRIPQFGKNK